jgi:hypothetical protein
VSGPSIADTHRIPDNQTQLHWLFHSPWRMAYGRVSHRLFMVNEPSHAFTLQSGHLKCMLWSHHVALFGTAINVWRSCCYMTTTQIGPLAACDMCPLTARDVLSIEFSLGQLKRTMSQGDTLRLSGETVFVSRLRAITCHRRLLYDVSDPCPNGQCILAICTPTIVSCSRDTILCSLIIVGHVIDPFGRYSLAEYACGRLQGAI